MAKNIAVIFTNSCVILKKTDRDWVKTIYIDKQIAARMKSPFAGILLRFY